MKFFLLFMLMLIAVFVTAIVVVSFPYVRELAASYSSLKGEARSGVLVFLMLLFFAPGLVVFAIGTLLRDIRENDTSVGSMCFLMGAGVCITPVLLNILVPESEKTATYGISFTVFAAVFIYIALQFQLRAYRKDLRRTAPYRRMYKLRHA